MADTAGVQVIQAGRDAGRARQLAAVRRELEPGAFGDAEGPGEVLRGPAPLVVGQAEAHHPLVGKLRGEPCERASVEGVPGAVGGDDHPDADAGRRLSVPCRVQQQLGECRDAAEAVGEA